MRIDFDDTSYVDISPSLNAEKVVIILSARDGKNPKNTIINSVEISKEQFFQISKEISFHFENKIVE